MSVFCSKTNKFTRGYTLLELIIVMTVIGVLVTATVVTYPNARGKARDSERISDIKQYQAALEVYANANNGTYPNIASSYLDVMCSGGTINLDVCPLGPEDDHYNYRGYSSGRFYFIYSQLEVENGGDTQWFVACSDGRTGRVNSSPSSATACPL